MHDSVFPKEASLEAALSRYSDFFALFDSFKGYVEFFLLQDLVNKDCSAIEFFMPFENFKSPAVPKALDSYCAYKDLVIQFVNKRNERILLAP